MKNVINYQLSTRVQRRGAVVLRSLFDQPIYLKHTKLNTLKVSVNVIIVMLFNPEVRRSAWSQVRALPVPTGGGVQFTSDAIRQQPI